MAIFNSYVSHYQRVNPVNPIRSHEFPLSHHKTPLNPINDHHCQITRGFSHPGFRRFHHDVFFRISLPDFPWDLLKKITMVFLRIVGVKRMGFSVVISISMMLAIYFGVPRVVIRAFGAGDGMKIGVFLPDFLRRSLTIQ